MEETLTLTRLGVTASAQADALLDQPVRADARDRPPHPPACWAALEIRALTGLRAGHLIWKTLRIAVRCR